MKKQTAVWVVAFCFALGAAAQPSGTSGTAGNQRTSPNPGTDTSGQGQVEDPTLSIESSERVVKKKTTKARRNEQAKKKQDTRTDTQDGREGPAQAE